MASVAADVLSFDTATVAMMGAKAGVRTALKAGTKVAAGLANKKDDRSGAQERAQS